MAVNDNKVVVSIVGDASGIRPAVDLSQSELNSLESTVRELTANFSRFGSEMKQSMDLGARETQQLTNEMRELNRAIERDEASMRQLGAATRATGATMGAMGGFVRGAIGGMIAAFSVQAVVGWTNAMGDAAERADHMAQQTGMAVAEVQALDVALAGSGLKMEDVAKGLGILATKAEVSGDKTNAAGNALKAMGISAKDGKTNLDRLLGIADQFKEMENGPRKAALAMQLFGKSGRDLIPFLNQGSAAIREQMALAERYGVVNERATERALALDAALDEQKIAWAGLKQTMTDAFAPLLTSMVRGFNDLVAGMVKSYKEGGAVKVIFDAIVLTIQAVREILGVVGAAFAELFSGSGDDAETWGAGIQEVIQFVVDAFKVCALVVVTVVDSFKVAFHLIYAAALNFKANWQEATAGIKLIGLALGLFIQNLAKAIENALLLRWGSIRSDWDAGMENLRRTVAAKGKEIIAEAAATRAKVQQEMAAAAGISSSYNQFAKNLGIGKPIGPADARVKPGADGAAGGVVPDFAPTKSGGGSKDKGDTIAEKLERELEAKKNAWALEQEAQGQMHRFSLQAEADFWEAALKRTDLGAKDKLAIEKKYVAARQALRREEIDKQLDSFKEEIETVGANSDAKLSILREEQAFVVRMYGAQSREARQAAEAIVAAERDKQRQLRELELETIKLKEDAALAGIDEAEAAAEFEVQVGRRTQGHLLAQQRLFENQRYQIQRQAMQRRIQLELQDPTLTPAKRAQLYAQLEQLERQHNAKIGQLDRAALLERNRRWEQANQVISSGLAKMITLEGSFRDNLVSIWQGLVGVVQQVVQEIIAQWITKFLILIGLEKVSASSGIMAEAAKAGAGGTASMAAAPFPINMTAPAFGASMFAAAAAYQGAAALSAEGGDWHVKPGLYELHKDEMVLPAWAASPLRSMISSGAAPGSPLANARGDATKASSKQENNFTYSPSIQHSNMSFAEMLRASERQMRRWFTNQVRNGTLKIPVS